MRSSWRAIYGAMYMYMYIYVILILQLDVLDVNAFGRRLITRGR